MFKFQGPRNFVRKNVAPLDEWGTLFKSESRRLESKFALIENEGADQELILTSSDGKKLRLNDHLPENVKFNGGAHNIFACGYPENNARQPGKSHINISFDSTQIDTVQGRLGLLHEIGHALDYPRPKEEKLSFLTRMIMRGIRRNIINSVEYMRMDVGGSLTENSETKKREFVKQFRKKWQAVGREYANEKDPPYRYNDLIEALGYMVREERDAWSNGLKLFKKIKTEQGIDILEGAKTSEIFDSVDGALATYEEGYGSILNDYKNKGPLRRVIEGYFT